MDAKAPSTKPQRQLTAAAMTGMSWSYGTAGGVAVIQLAYTAVMARLLTPRAFGLYAIALLVMNLGNSFAGMGVAQAIIQKPSVTSKDIRAASTSGILLGLLFFGLMWVLAPPVSQFFTEKDAIPLLRVMGIHFILLGIGLTAQALLRKELRFRELAIAHLASYTIGYAIVGPGMALAGAGVWSLAAAVLTAHLFHSAFQYALVRHSLQPVFEVRAFKDLYSFGARVSVLSFFEFLGRQLDTFAVGRYVSTALLGQYSRAFVIVSLPMSQHLTQAITRVLFPGFSKIQSDVPRLRRAYLSVLTLSGTLMFSVAAGMAVAAREIVLVLMGDQWDVAITLVPFFALAVSFSIMTRFAELVCQARAELNSVLGLQGTYLLLLAAGYVAVSVFGGVVPFAVMLAVGEVLRHLAFTALLHRVLGVAYRQVAQAYAPAFAAAVGVAGAVALGRQILLLDGVPLVVVLATEIMAGAVGLALLTRWNPFPRVRGELRARLLTSGVQGRRHTVRTRLVTLLVGRPPAGTTVPTVGSLNADS